MWELAKRNNKTAQGNQKLQYDRNSKPPKFRVGDRVFVYMPSAKACKAYKFARPFYGPYQIIEQSETGVVVRPVDKPQAEPIRVAYDRIQRCSNAIPDKFGQLVFGIVKDYTFHPSQIAVEIILMRE